MIHRLVRLTALIGAIALAGPAAAQPAPELALVAPRLVIAAPAEAPVTLRAVRVRTEINGRSALTSIELTFHNPNARQLEGELQFPLREGQTVVGMAIDVNGTLRDAVAIEKARGEAVFEDVTRTRIDPALLSATQGDNYKLRVYPLAPQSDKVVVVRIAEWLVTRNGRTAYRLPLDYGRLASFSMSMQVSGVGARPAATNPAAAALAFSAAGNGYRLDWTATDAALKGALDVALTPAAGGSVTTQRVDGHDYFVAQLPIAPRSAPRTLPGVVTLAWDASGSGAARDHGRELALLDAYFAQARRMTVQLVRLRDAAEPAQRFEVRDGQWRELRAALETMVYDGATNLGAFVPDAQAGEVLLFSDGLSNFGAMQRFDAGAAPVYTINAATRADAARLRDIAERSGGRSIDLSAEAVAAASAKLLRASTRVVALEADGATQLVAASTRPSDGALTLAGELTAARAQVRAIVEHPDGRRQTVALAVDAARDVGTLAAQAWARLKVASLEGEYEFHRAEIRRLGLAHAIVTRGTSLIILDRAQDYARHGVTPPPELAAEVAQLRAQMARSQQSSADAQLERVVKAFEARQAWWSREFPKGAPPKAEAEKKVMGDALEAPRSAGVLRERRADEALRAAPMAAAPAPAQMSNSFAAARDVAQATAKSAAGRGEAAADATTTTIRLRPAANDTPYLTRLRAVPAEQMYRHYLDERAGYANSTAFILDVADLMYQRGEPALATRVLSNLAEMDLENRQVLRILAARLVQAQRADLAVPVYAKVLVLAPDEPQSQRDLGLALAAAGQPQAAVDALYEVARKQWPRFPEIELIALAEMNAIIATSPSSTGRPIDTARIDPRLLKNLPLDLRATLSWDADNTDIDLWITDPNGETAYYGHPDTYQGGHVSRDITSGYGPEEFSLKRAKPGKYTVRAKFYGHRQQIVSGATTIQLDFYSAFGTPRQKQQGVTLRLKEAKDQLLVGEFVVSGPVGSPELVPATGPGTF